MPFPSTKIARQARIVELLQTRRVRSQAELAQYLTDDGMKVTQATLSRDLVEIGAERIRDEGAGLIYAVPNYPLVVAAALHLDRPYDFPCLR